MPEEGRQRSSRNIWPGCNSRPAKRDKAIEAARDSRHGPQERSPAAGDSWSSCSGGPARRTMPRRPLDDLRTISGSIDRCTAPFYARARTDRQRVAASRTTGGSSSSPKSDTGIRPALDSLGPFRWQPTPAPGLDAEGCRAAPTIRWPTTTASRSSCCFFLGHGCLHCAEQLQAFGGAAKEFDARRHLARRHQQRRRGGPEAVHRRLQGTRSPCRSWPTARSSTFKAYRCYDDFEHQPLHGTFFIDGDRPRPLAGHQLTSPSWTTSSSWAKPAGCWGNPGQRRPPHRRTRSPPQAATNPWQCAVKDQS